jgi:hypothetical protein
MHKNDKASTRRDEMSRSTRLVRQSRVVEWLRKRAPMRSAKARHGSAPGFDRQVEAGQQVLGFFVIAATGRLMKRIPRGNKLVISLNCTCLLVWRNIS